MAESSSSGPVSPGNPSQASLVKGQGVSLGCGTLILIALIVLLFSGRGDRELRRDVRALRSEVAELKKSVDAQSAEIKAIRQKLEAAEQRNP